MPLDFTRFGKILVLAFGICALAVTMAAIRIIRLKTDVTHPESAELAGIVAGPSGPLYPDLNRPPYTPCPYGPLFYSTVKVMARAFGGEIERTRVACRVFTFCCFLLLPVMVYLLLRSAAVCRTLSLLGAFASVSFYFMPLFAASVRPDFPALLLSVSALWLASLRPGPARVNLILAGIVCTSAFMFKGSFVAASLAIGVLLMTEKRYRDLSVFVVSALIAAFLFLDVVFRGDPVIQRLLTVNKSPTDLLTAIGIIVTALPTGAGPVLLPAACLVSLPGNFSADWRLRLYSLYFLFAVGIGFTILRLSGGNLHYFFELWVASAVLLPFALMKLKNSWERIDWSPKVGAILVLVFLCVQQIHATHEVAESRRDFHAARLHNLHVLSTEPYLTIQGRDPHLLDPFFSAILEKAKQWSPEPILSEVRQQSFDVVFLKEPDHHPVVYRKAELISPSIQEELRRSYRPICWTTDFVVLRPLRREVGFTAEDASTVLGEHCFAIGDETF